MTDAGAAGGECVIGIDVGGTMLKGGVRDRDAAIVHGERRPTARDDADALVDGIVALAGDLAAEGRRRFGADGVAGVGLAVPGLVDEARGVALRAVNLPWRDLALAKVASGRLGLPVLLSHDVRAAAAAEAALGAGRGSDDFLFVAIGTGIGAAIVHGGRPFTGAHGRAGELGHLVVDPGGPPCACGARGCLEAIASAAAIERAYAAAGVGRGRAGDGGGDRDDAGDGVGDRDDAGDGASAREVAALAQAGDPVAREVWARAARALGAALADAVALLDPGLVVARGRSRGGGRAAARPGRRGARGALAPRPAAARGRCGARRRRRVPWRRASRVAGAGERPHVGFGRPGLPPARRDRHDARPPMTSPPAEVVLFADAVFTPAERLADGWVHVRGARIAAVGSGPVPPGMGAPVVRLPAGACLAPGFIDLHVHGGGGAQVGARPARGRGGRGLPRPARHDRPARDDRARPGGHAHGDGARDRGRRAAAVRRGRRRSSAAISRARSSAPSARARSTSATSARRTTRSSAGSWTRAAGACR